MLRRALLRGSAALLGCGASAALGACAAPPRPAPPPAPALRSPGDIVPSDLDVAVRLDLGSVKAALGAGALTALAREVLAQGSASRDSADELVVSSLLDAELVYLSYRPSALLAPLDRVLSLQGRFEPFVRAPAGFRPPVDLGGDVRYWDRLPNSKPARTSVARIYAVGDRLRAFVSEAEIDAVERALDGQGQERRLNPPEEGTISLAARPYLLARLSGGASLRDLLEQAKALQAVAAFEADGVTLKLELVMGDADAAARLASAGQTALGSWLTASRGALSAESDRVLLRARLSRAQLAPALGCLGGASGGACPW